MFRLCADEWKRKSAVVNEILLVFYCVFFTFKHWSTGLTLSSPVSSSCDAVSWTQREEAEQLWWNAESLHCNYEANCWSVVRSRAGAPSSYEPPGSDSKSVGTPPPTLILYILCVNTLKQRLWPRRIINTLLWTPARYILKKIFRCF